MQFVSTWEKSIIVSNYRLDSHNSLYIHRKLERWKFWSRCAYVPKLRL